MQESAITAKGQTTLPKAVREALGVSPGDRVRYVVDGDVVRLLKVLSVMDLAGVLCRPGGAPASLEEIEAGTAAGAAGDAGLE